MGSKISANVGTSDEVTEEEIHRDRTFYISTYPLTPSWVEREKEFDKVPQCEWCEGNEKVLAPYTSKDIYLITKRTDACIGAGVDLKDSYYVCSKHKLFLLEMTKDAYEAVELYQVRVLWYEDENPI